MVILGYKDFNFEIRIYFYCNRKEITAGLGLGSLFDFEDLKL